MIQAIEKNQTSVNTRSVIESSAYVPSFSLAKVVSVLLAGQIGSQIIAFPIGVLFARAVGPVHYGHYATAAGLSSSLAGLFLMGVDLITMRETARQPKRAGKLLTSAFVPMVFWSMLTIIIVALLASALGYSAEVRLLMWPVAAESAIIGLLNLVRAAFRGVQKMEWDALSRIAESILALVLVTAAVLLHTQILILAVALVTARFLVLTALYPSSRRALKSSFIFDRVEAWRLLRLAFPIGVAGLISSVNYRLDTVLLALWKPAQQVGMYNVAYIITFTWLPVCVSLARAIAPELSSVYHAGDRNRFWKLFDQGLRYILSVGLPIAATTAVLSTQLVTFLYGRSYAPAGIPLAILSVVILVLFFNNYFLNVLVATDRHVQFLPITIAGLVVMAIAGIILIPPFGLVGAASAVLLRETAQMIIYSFLIFRGSSWRVSRAAFLPPIVGTVVLAAIFLLLRQILGVLVLVPIGWVAYVVVLKNTGGLGVDLRKAARATGDQIKRRSGR